MATGFELNYGISDFEKSLSGMVRFAQFDDPNADRPALEAFGEYMIVRTELLFATGSRDGVTWPRLEASTKRSRKAKGIGGSDPLVASGDLKRSIRFSVVRYFAGLSTKVYTRNPLAKIHQGGAHINAHEIRPVKGKVLAFPGADGKTVFATKVNIPAFDIPARPILFISDRDEKTGLRYIRDGRLKLMRQMFKNAKVAA